MSELIDTRSRMVTALKTQFTERDQDFLLTFKRGKPGWSLFDEPSAAKLPAIRWKLMNIQHLSKNQDKHQEKIKKLDEVLEQWLQAATT
ncbi:hypothetical protein [Endozoicomonas gorgoniicola]